ncbi:dentin sialophosphoprotein-like protein [Actinidia rufa]|uniref:Dentin sialophosphoprotein-like protein n=1 Tax=Actinidia rufa TaxID=165716 RepID=A0A7J0GN39_9ERIC|nr:dentin sialophosphoprotein-like protein [Actinidia rufa]
MTDNEVGDRVHNFFSQDNLSQGQHHSQVVDGSWQVLGNNLWAGSQRHVGLLSSNSKNYNLQQSADIERGHSNHSFPVSHDLNLTQSVLRPELANSRSQSQQPNLNGYMHERQILQTRQNETNFLGVDTESDCHNMTSRGLPTHKSQQGNGPGNYATSIRSDLSESPVSFDFFGDQQQVSCQQTGMLQSFPRQHSGFSEMQLQQQVMLRKMQELKRQQQIQQLEARQQSSMNQIATITRQASGSHSPALINSTPISSITEASNYSCASEPTAGNTNWLQRATPAIQGSSNGFKFSPEHGQAQNLMSLVPQQVDQSLYGIPISNTRGGSHLYSHVPMDKSSMQQITMYNNSFPGNQHTGFQDQVSPQDGSFVYREGFLGENMFGHAPVQGLNGGMNLENLHQVNASLVNAPLQEFHEKQERPCSSDTLQEKTVMQVSSSQNAVALDPTEEKILFGDDNIWDAFGSSIDAEAGGFNPSNGTGFLNRIPSLQSGSWSALMQSAVAETSSNNIGLREEWSGLSSQNTDVRAGNHQFSTYETNSKQETEMADYNLQIASGLSSGSVPLSHDANINKSYQGVSGPQQPGQTHSYMQGESPDRRSIQKTSKEGSKWLSRVPLQKPAEWNQNYGNAAHPPSVSSYSSGQPPDKPNVRGVCESRSASGDATMKIHGNENKSPRLYNEDQKKMTCEGTSHGGHIGKADSGPNSIFGSDHVKSAIVSSHVNREDYSFNSLAAIPNSTSGRASEDTTQLFSNSHQLNYWKHADSSMKGKGSENSGKSQNQLNKGKSPQVLESSMTSFGNDVVNRRELMNCDRKENSSDSHDTNSAQHPTSGGLKENLWSDGSDSQNLPGGKQKSSSQAGRKTPGPRKFQYHPMGNLDEDVEPSYGVKHGTFSQAMSQQIPRASYDHNQGYFGQSRFFGLFSKTSTEVEKGHSLDLQENKKGHDESPSQGTHPAFSPNVSAPFDRSLGKYAPNKAPQSSQNMLELLHKVDQPKECANYDGSVGQLLQNKSSASQGCNLQLAPPSQWQPVQNRALASQGSAQLLNSFNSSLTSPEIRDKGHTWLASTAQVQSLPSSHETSQGEFKFNKIGVPGQTGNEASQYSIQDFPNSRSQLQNQQMIISSGKLPTNQSMNISSDRQASHLQQTDYSTCGDATGQSTPALLPDHDRPVSSADTSQPTVTNHFHERVSGTPISVRRAIPSSQHFIASGPSQHGAFPKTLPNAWTNVPGQQHSFANQPHKSHPSIFSSIQSNDNVVSTSPTKQDQVDQNGEKRWNDPSDLDTNSMHSQGFVRGEGQPAKECHRQMVSSENIDLAKNTTASQVKESVKNLSEASPLNPASSQRDIDAFGRSLKPSSLLHQNFSLLQQMQAMKSTEIDPSNRGLKRSKGADSDLDCQMAPKTGQSSEHNVMVGDSLIHSSAVLSGDSKMLSFSGPMDNNRETNSSSQLGMSSFRVEHSQISPQMAPSWFNQFGTFQNGQILSMYDAQKCATVKTVEQLHTIGKSSDSLCAHSSLEQVSAAADSNQVLNIWQKSTPTSVAIEHFSSPQSLALDVAGQHLVVARPKKRKSATSELLPWHKEVMQGSRSLLTISMAEVNWARAANRVIDKLEDEAEVIEDGPPMCRPKRRLIFTTQLMQQLFSPPPLAVLSTDASSNYETVAYLVSKLALVDACSIFPRSGSDSSVPFDSTNLLSDEHKTSRRTDDQHLPKVMEDFIGRARNLEKDFMRLDKRTSVSDLKIECQDLEKFSVINRFARFHARGQAEAAETSSSSDATPNGQRQLPQRYVTALPVPRNLPDRVQCLSL